MITAPVHKINKCQATSLSRARKGVLHLPVLQDDGEVVVVRAGHLEAAAVRGDGVRVHDGEHILAALAREPLAVQRLRNRAGPLLVRYHIAVVGLRTAVADEITCGAGKEGRANNGSEHSPRTPEAERGVVATH